MDRKARGRFHQVSRHDDRLQIGIAPVREHLLEPAPLVLGHQDSTNGPGPIKHGLDHQGLFADEHAGSTVRTTAVPGHDVSEVLQSGVIGAIDGRDGHSWRVVGSRRFGKVRRQVRSFARGTLAA